VGRIWGEEKLVWIYIRREDIWPVLLGTKGFSNGELMTHCVEGGWHRVGFRWVGGKLPSLWG
jgi:hypothetical protein